MATPSLRDRFRPAELLGLSAILAAFLGLIVLLTTRDWMLAGIAFGVGFIVAVVVIAMLALAVKPHDGDDDEIDKPVLN